MAEIEKPLNVSIRPYYVQIVHKGCGGIVEFFHEKGMGLENERVCRQCGRQETYEPDKAIFVGRPGVAEKELRDLCRDCQLPVLDCQFDRTNRRICAVLISTKGFIDKSDPKTWQGWFDRIEKDQPIILAAFRKPLALSLEGARIPYC